jgi:Fe-S cluster assembly protein SufD
MDNLFAGLTLPTEAEEVWRYSRIDELDLEAYRPLTDDDRAGLDRSIPPSVQGFLDAIGEATVVLAKNGKVVEGDAGQADPDVLGSLAGEGDAFGTLNVQYMGQPVVIDVPARRMVERPIVVVHHVDVAGGAAFPRSLVTLGDQAQATVIEIVVSPDVDAFIAPVAELIVGDAANLGYATIQALGPKVWQVAYQVSSVGRDATLHSAAVALGGDYARLRTDSALTGQGGTSNLLAAYFGDGRQMHDFRTLQDHAGPRTTSDLLFKGAVIDQAHSVYSGLIRVRKGAAGTNAFQTNRNLVLSEGAHADSVPNLDIQENDLRCSHASTVGPIDEEQRYYLEARGIPTDVAERLIVLGFLDDVLDKLPVPALAPVLRHAVASKLDRTRL